MVLDKIFKPTNKTDGIKEKEDVIRRRAEQLLNTDSKQSMNQPATSKAEEKFIDKLTEGAINSLKRNGYFDKKGINWLSSSSEKRQNLAENTLPDNDITNAESLIRQISPDNLTQDMENFISSFLAAEAYNDKAKEIQQRKQLYMRRDPEKFAKGLRDANAELSENPMAQKIQDIQYEFPGIKREFGGKITVEVANFNVDSLNPTMFNLTNVDLWKITGGEGLKKKLNTYNIPEGDSDLYKRTIHKGGFGNSMEVAEEALHQAQYFGRVAENSDLCRDILLRYVKLRQYTEEGYEEHLRPEMISESLLRSSKQLLENNKAALDSDRVYISKKEFRQRNPASNGNSGDKYRAKDSQQDSGAPLTKLEKTRNQLEEQLRQAHQHITSFEKYMRENGDSLENALAASFKDMGYLKRELETANSNREKAWRVLFGDAEMDLTQLEDVDITQTQQGPVIGRTEKGLEELEGALALLQPNNEALEPINKKVQDWLSKKAGKSKV